MEERIIKQRLEMAEEKLQLLKTQSKNTQMSIRTILELASQIRDSISKDEDITEFCNTSKEYALQRQKLLDEIRKIQLNIIEEHTRQYKDLENFDGNIKDFDKAKQDLVAMIEAEQAKRLFEESESPKLLESIADCKKHSATICSVAENCKNGRFLVLILGDFQSGKSTTIDALCDGRHISAIGDGTATSAVLVSVSYAEKESVRIYWRGKEQFMPIFERLKRVMPDYAWHTFDLDKSTERANLANAIEMLRRSKDGEFLESGDVKFLMLCDFILAYYGTEKLQVKKNSFLSISSISGITRFPKEGESKWKKEGVKGFTINDAIFVFIDFVACSIPSETLKRLNCTIIDSPGLFNSAYDTMVTESAMVAAHAIIYVLPYQKGIGENVCGSLYTIRDKYHDVHNKLFIVNNVDSLKENAFIESNREFIKTTFGPEKEVFVYDAKVSYLTQLKSRYDMGLATSADYAHLMHAKRKTPIGRAKELHFQTFDEAWDFYMIPYKAAYGTNDTSSIDTYLKDYGFSDTVSALKAFIEKNKAYAIILSNALIPMRSELVAIKRELCKRYIEPYTTSYEELVKIWKKRITQAENFQKFVTDSVKTELFHENDEPSVCDKISYEEYEKIFTSDFYSEIAKEIAGVLYDNKSTFIASQAMRAIRDDVSIQVFPPKIKFKDNGRFQKVFGDLVSPLIKDKLTDVISCRLKYALETIDSEQDKTIVNLFSPVAKNIKLLLEREWNTIFKDDNEFDMSNYLTVPSSLRGCVIEKKTETSSTDLTSDLGIGATLLGGIVVQITTIVTGIAAMIAGYIGAILCDPTFTALIACVLLGIGGAIISFIAPDHVRDTFVDFLTKRVEPKIKTDASASFKKLVNDQIRIILERYVNGRVVDIQKMKNQRDIALAQNPHQEAHCFRAIEIIQKVKNQVAVYDNYKKTHLKI